MKGPRAFGLVATIVLLPRFAFAQPDALPKENNVQPVRLSYAADSDCPSKENFVQAIRDRGLSIREADDATRAMSVTLVRDSQSGQWNGELRIHDAHGDASRDVSAGSCADVARSIALFASLALTPEAEAPPSPAPPPSLPVRLPTPIPAKNKPIVVIAKPPHVELDLLHRDRFFVGAEANFFLSSQTFENFAGVGAVATYSFSRRISLGLSADLLHSFADKSSEPTPAPPTTSTVPAGATMPPPTSETALLKVMLRLPIMLHVASGTFDGRPGSPFDFFVAPAVGTVVTKPNNYPAQIVETYSPGVAFALDAGVRAFISQSFSLTAQVGFLFFEERYLQASYLFDGRGVLTSATYRPGYYGNFGPLFQLGAEFDLPGAPAAR